MSDRSSSLIQFHSPISEAPEDDRPLEVRVEERRRAMAHFETMQNQQLDFWVNQMTDHQKKEKETQEALDAHALRPALVPDLSELDDVVIHREELHKSWETDDGVMGDDFFASHAEKLVGKISLLVATHFKQGPVRFPDDACPWGLKDGGEEDTALEQYAKRIARPDMLYGRPWDSLLTSEDSRFLLLLGIIMRMLDDHVFSRMLFGASPEQERELQDMDQDQVDDGGFARSRVRSATVNLLLQRNRGMPVNFWEHVDELTHAIAMQLWPVLTFVWLSKPEDPSSFGRFYQHLHNQVAYAGWWTVQVRRSPAIVTFKWPTPGDPWEDKMEHVGSDIFEASQCYADEVDAMATRHEKTRKPIRRARVQIVASPEIRRYVPQIEGHNDFRILRTFVACYHGLYFDNEDEREFLHHDKAPEDFDTDLVQYALTRRAIRIQQERQERLRQYRERAPVTLRIILTLTTFLFFRFVLYRTTGMSLKDVWEAYVAPQVARALELATANATTPGNVASSARRIWSAQ